MTKIEDKKAAALTKKWLAAINDAQERENKYRQLGKEVVNLYEAKHPENTPFAILYSNTETLVPALYNARPIPIVKRRFKDPDPVGKCVADVSTRTLKFLIDTEDENYDAFDDLIQADVISGVLTNRGLSRFRYKDHGEERQYKAECVYGETVRWDKFFHGYARTWKKVPWIGFEWDMTKEELKSNFRDVNFDDAVLKRMAQQPAEEGDGRDQDKDELRGATTYKVYEIWDKDSRKVMFFSGASPDKPLRIADDPLKLSNFFPVPRPLNFTRKVTSLVPVPLYQQYRAQAAELNSLTIRLKAIIKACKVRGFYNSSIGDIEKVLEAEDNKLIPAENMQALGENPNVSNMIWLAPINELVQSAQTLYQQREQVKQVIYEITGISDILRGASVASETATAQNIKNQWGTLRLKKMQKEVQRYCRDALQIMLEIASKRFEQKTFEQMTGLPYLTNQEKATAQAAIQQQVQGFQQQVAQAQAMGQQPPQPPPQAQQMLETAQQELAKPTWEEILAVMKNDIAFFYKTDIETNSTIDAEAAQDKQDISELMNAMGQLLNAIGPLVEKGTMPIDVAKNLLLVICRRFNFGTEIEDSIMQMKAPTPQADPNEQAKAESAKAQLEADKQKAALDAQKTKQEMELSMLEFNQKKELMVLEAAIAKQELAIKQQELALQTAGMKMKADLQERTHRQKMEAARQPKKETANASA